MNARWTLALLAASSLFGQAAAPVAFEVASIKPSEQLTPQKIMGGKANIGMKLDGARVDIGYLGLGDLIMMAYKIKKHQLQGPDWMNAQRFDISAKIPAGAAKEQVPEMLQALLAERFGLKCHRDSKETAMYALVVGKGGPKLKDADPDPDPATVAAAEAAAPAKGVQTFSAGGANVRIAQAGNGTVVTTSGTGGLGSTKVEMGSDGMMHMELTKVTMPMFAEMLVRFVDKPVMDQTELKGNYKATLDLTMADMLAVARASGADMSMMRGGPGMGAPGAGEASDPSGGSVFQSVQKLGLKLEPKKAPVEILIVDHLEKMPTEN